jgi:hypothetical protein
MRKQALLAAFRLTFLAAMTASIAFVSMSVSTWSVPEQPPDYGLRGLRRVQLVFLAPRAGEDPSKRRECRSIGAPLGRVGIEVVEACRRDDAACGKLFFTVESSPIGEGGGSMYVAEIELSQPVQLLRDPTRELSSPTTWSARTFGIVDEHHSLAAESCLRLGDLAIRFAAEWRTANP